MKTPHLLSERLITRVHCHHEDWLKSQGFPMSIQNAPSTFGDTSPQHDHNELAIRKSHKPEEYNYQNERTFNEHLR